MSSYKVVTIASEVAMNTPRREYYRKDGITAYSCLIPQTRDVAHEVHFVSGADGDEYGQYPHEHEALDRATAVVRANRREADHSPSP